MSAAAAVAAAADVPVTLRPTLRHGSSGPMVRLLQNLLNAVLGAGTLSPDGDFGGGTVDAVSLFQYRVGLPITGVVGSMEWFQLQQLVGPGTGLAPSGSSLAGGAVWSLQPPAFSQLLPQGPGLLGSTEPQTGLASLAAPYVGVRETGDNRIGASERLREIFEADNLTIGTNTDGYAWCCAFVSLCTQKLIAANPVRYARVLPPRESLVDGLLYTWAAAQKCLVFKPSSRVIRPQMGDICVFTFSHIGIVEAVNPSSVDTIEGNTNEAGGREGTGVWRKSRSLSIVRRFVRLPVFRLGPGL